MSRSLSQHFLGIMSGTSLDGVDVVLADFASNAPSLRNSYHLPFPPELRAELLALNQPGPNELERSALAANQLVQHYAQAVMAVLTHSRTSATDIAAIGCHGQTVRHRPDLGYTLQLNNPALLAELTGSAVIADFRSRDIAAGGQGAPLVPAFHAAVFRHAEKNRVIVNIGGIANITSLPSSNAIVGFDCGPGNLLLDAWCLRYTGQIYDANGIWAASGKPIAHLLHALHEEDFFHTPPPKSTGRDLFSLEWLARFLKPEYAPQDVQATLLKLTVDCIHNAVMKYCGTVDEVFVCGGGARNGALMNSLRHAFAAQAVPVAITDTLGIDAQWVEALAFAWLAHRTLQHQPGNLPEVTGAAHPCVLGAIYPP